MKLLSLYTALVYISIMFLSYSKNAPAAGTPVPGSKRVLVKDIEYVSGKIEGSENRATWPVAAIQADLHAVRYTVKVLHSGKTYTWKAGTATGGAYDVYPSTNNLKDWNYYVGLGRTWGSGLPDDTKNWEENYRNEVFTTSNKVEITYHY